MSTLLKAVIRALIRFYQRILSPMLHFGGGPAAGCRFHPTCSNYFMQAVETHGVIRGCCYGIWRILRCHPWGGSGYDPVPQGRPKQEHESCGCECSTPPAQD